MRVVISAGDPSGDVRAAELVTELSRRVDISVSGLGGPHLRESGVSVLFDLEEYSVMGFAEVLTSLGRFRRLRNMIRRHIEEAAPDIVLLVDYPGFNIPLARWASSRGFRVVYYISPQLWAWGRGRVRKIRGSVDLMITLFEFEVDFYREHGVRAFFAGHPLADSIPEPMETGLTGRIALLPGSRRQEVSMLAGPMADAYGLLREGGLVGSAAVAVSGSVPNELYDPILRMEGVSAAGSVREALTGAAAAVVCSGTATLETAMWGIPFIVTYRTSRLTWSIARLLVRGVRNIGMANLVAGEEYFPELLQNRVTPEGIAECISSMLRVGPERNRALEGTTRVREALGEPGSSARAAEALIRSAGE
ncbi:MAG: hypothetical protein AVO35_04020 [Candidatus Aegiribacteria sp. MLS_C]|nr:MAG: hypothetical protein AVO35_04020 [Candidatus Aegiribacteria sp. MLS_C]